MRQKLISLLKPLGRGKHWQLSTEVGRKNCYMKESYLSHNQVVKRKLLSKVQIYLHWWVVTIMMTKSKKQKMTEKRQKVMPNENRNLFWWILTEMILMAVEGKRRQRRGSTFSWTLGELVYINLKDFPERRHFDTKDNMASKS